MERELSGTLCRCGCGQETFLAMRTIAARGHIKGQPLPFLKGHFVPPEVHYRYIGHTVITGYRYIRKPDHPHCHANGLIAEHRLVMESELGRYLLPHEVVHHKNGDKLDNRPDNLEVMTQSRHASQHLKGNTYGSKGERWSLKYECCIVCGTTDKPHTSKGRCNTCNQREWRQARKDAASAT